MWWRYGPDAPLDAGEGLLCRQKAGGWTPAGLDAAERALGAYTGLPLMSRRFDDTTSSENLAPEMFEGAGKWVSPAVAHTVVSRGSRSWGV